jgi:diguanylate cyclase (GGDEF)-like protein
MTMQASVGIAPSLIETIQVPLGAGIAGLVAERGISLLGRSLSNETFVCAPVVTRQGIEGVLNLTNRLGGKQYGAGDLTSTGIVATHIGHLIDFRREANVDVLTRLANRRAFEETLDRELARGLRTNTQFSLVFIDTDELKVTNDQFGHAKGDELLRNLANIVQEEIRQYDFAARFAGDEFVALLATDSNKGVQESREAEASFGRRLLTRCARHKPSISISMGVSRFPEDGRTAADLLRVADERMYEYKRLYGRGRTTPLA